MAPETELTNSVSASIICATICCVLLYHCSRHIFDLCASVAKRKASELLTTIKVGEESATDRRTNETITRLVDSFSNDLLVVIFDFIPRRDLVHNVSLVSKRWLDNSRSPTLWHTLDDKEGTGVFKFRYSPHLDDIVRFNQLLGRKQFSRLKKICPPQEIVYKNKGFKIIANNCPAIEEIDTWNSSLPRASLLQLPKLFPNLNRLHVRLYDVNCEDLVGFCKMMGNRLVGISIHNCWRHFGVDNDFLAAISQSCTNLEHFCYCVGQWRSNFTERGVFTESDAFSFTESGIMALVTNCSRLNSLSFIGTTWIKSGFYRNIVENATNLNHLVVVGYSDFETISILETCSWLSRGEALVVECISKHRNLQLIEECLGKPGGAFYFGHQWYH